MTPAGLVAAALALAAAAPASGGDLGPTLEKVRAAGAITLGHRESSIPFSYYDDRQQVVGYSQELMLRVVEAVKAELRLPALAVRLVPVTSQNRIPLVQNGTVDLECGSTTHNAERARQVAFSTTIFVVETRLMTRADSGIKDFGDLRGKNVVTTAGTTSERLLRKLDAERKLGVNVISAKDHGEAFLTLETGRAAAFMMDDALLYGEMAKARRPSDWMVTGTPQSREAYGCMMRTGDVRFKKLVDATLARVMTSGQAEVIYRKWFQSPIPPRGLNLNFPLSDAMKRLFRAPDDRPLD